MMQLHTTAPFLVLYNIYIYIYIYIIYIYIYISALTNLRAAADEFRPLVTLGLL